RKRIYVANLGDDSVSVIDTTDPSPRLVGKIRVVGLPQGAAVSPDGTRVYVTSRFYNSISVIDVAHNRVAAEVEAGNADTVAVSADSTQVYVGDKGTDTISIVNNGARPTVVARIPVGACPAGIAVSPAGVPARLD